jgi:hypothetical protein
MNVTLDLNSAADYQKFLSVKSLPRYAVHGRTMSFPDEYADKLGLAATRAVDAEYEPWPGLFDYQRDIAAMAIQKQKFAAFVEPGYGKGLPPDTAVLSPTGWRLIGSLVEGDKLIGADGLQHAVTGVFRRGVQNLYRITFSDGTKIVCDGDHLWNVKNNNDHARGKPWKTVSTSSLAVEYSPPGPDVSKSRRLRIPLISSPEFESHWEVIHPYVLGVLLGDGSISHEAVSWHKPDSDIATRIAALLPAGTTVHKNNQLKCDQYVIGSGRNKENVIKSELARLGLMGTRSSTKFVPKSYLFASKSDRIALLQGLMDTDGYAGITPEFSSASKDLADAVIFLVQSLGGTASAGIKESPKYEYKGETRTGQPSHRVSVSLPSGINPFYLPRKADLYQEKSGQQGRWIDLIEATIYLTTQHPIARILA